MSDLFLRENPKLKDIQEYISKMKVERGFNNTDPIYECVLLAEEVGELLGAVRRTTKGAFLDANKPDRNDSVKEEIADVLIFLLNIANMYNIDVEQAFRDKEEINKKRTWKKV